MWRRTYLPVSVRLAMSFLSLQLRLTENIRWLFPIGNVCVTGGHVTSRNQDLSWSSSSWCHIHPLCLEAERQWRQGKKANQLPHYWMVICHMTKKYKCKLMQDVTSDKHIKFAVTLWWPGFLSNIAPLLMCLMWRRELASTFSNNNKVYLIYVISFSKRKIM